MSFTPFHDIADELVALADRVRVLGDQVHNGTYTVPYVPTPPSEPPSVHIDTLDSDTVSESSSPATFSVVGTGFVDGSSAEVDGGTQPTMFVSDTQVTFLYTPSTAGTYAVSVRNPDDSESNDVQLTVSAAVSRSKARS